MKNIYKLILTIIRFVIFLLVLPALSAEAASQAANQAALQAARSDIPSITSAPFWVQALLTGVCGLMALVALAPLFGQSVPTEENLVQLH